jgi:hypothetical protein
MAYCTIAPPSDDDDDEYGVISGMIGTGNRSTLRKLSTVPLSTINPT